MRAAGAKILKIALSSARFPMQKSPLRGDLPSFFSAARLRRAVKSLFFPSPLLPLPHPSDPWARICLNKGGLVISDRAKILDLTRFLLVQTTLDPQNGRFTISAPSAHTFFAFLGYKTQKIWRKSLKFELIYLKIFSAPSAPLLYYIKANSMALPIGRTLVYNSTV